MATSTAEAEAATPATEPIATFPRHRLTIDRYLAMVEAGIFGEDEPIFLWRGELVEKMTKGRNHTIVQLVLQNLLLAMMPETHHVEIEAPMVVGETSLPEPDLSVIRGAIRDYPDRPPGARDAALVIEVADSSLRIDSVTKLAAYAFESIPIYWIVKLAERRIEVCSGPTGPAEPATYRERRTYNRGEEVPVVLDGREVGRVPVDAIFPADRG
ncbi:Uma2 family endonuclease [Tundrisphaera sp. TA3]|uniref:Uma2 family endonuclease n=1 Tax=Tundrisphaera sp. TA3 TaxID=3435775 RepID=UPI003EBDC609